jgi:3-oxoadipate enol-lactonase
VILERSAASIHYEVAGAGPAIVFAHGLGGNHLSWWQQVPHFAPRHTCVSFAHRGFHPSSAAPGSPVASAFAEDIRALLDRLRIERAVLVCQSMGGWGGLEFALEHPERVSALVMACTSGTVDYHQLPGLERHWLQAWEEKSRRAAVELPKRGASLPAGERMAREQPALHGLYAGLSGLTPPDFRDQVRREILALRHHSPEILSRLRMPVLYLEGEEDLVFPPAAGPALAALTPKGRHASVPECGHSVYFERAERFNRLVDEFLDANR